MLDRRNGLRITRMKIEITVTNRINGTAAAADQTAGFAEGVLGIVRMCPNRIACTAYCALKRIKNLRSLLWHYRCGLSHEFAQQVCELTRITKL